jgi:Ribonuclease G/E
LCYQIIRDIEKENTQSPEGRGLTLYVHEQVAEFFTVEERNTLDMLEKKIGRHISLKVDPHLHFEDYEIFSRDS